MVDTQYNTFQSLQQQELGCVCNVHMGCGAVAPYCVPCFSSDQRTVH